MKKERAGRLAGLVCGAAVLTLAVSAALLDSRYDLQLTKYELFFADLPPEFDGFRIVQLSDLHGMSFRAGNAGLTEQVLAQRPDIIVMTGDMAGKGGDTSALEPLVRALEGGAPVFFVNGNHEWSGGKRREATVRLLESGDVRLLSNVYETFEFNGSRIVIAGAEDPNGPADMVSPSELAARLRAEYPDDFVLWLAHRNYWVERYPKLPVDLILCGHAHGGIIRLPGIGGLLNINHSFGAEYESGVYYSGDYAMEVSRGLGNSVAIPRLFNRPELVTVILRSGQS